MEEKVSLPIKTKIAAWWMIIIGGIYLLYFLAAVAALFLPPREPSFIEVVPIPPEEVFFSGLKFTLPGIFGFFLPGIFLFLKKNWTWKFAIAMLIITNIFYLLLNPNSGLYYIISLPPFFLLFFDRKNFWKVVR